MELPQRAAHAIGSPTSHQSSPGGRRSWSRDCGRSVCRSSCVRTWGNPSLNSSNDSWQPEAPNDNVTEPQKILLISNRPIMHIMTDNKPHDTLGWEFTYELSDEVDCSSDISDRQDIEFITGFRKKQKTITGIKITVNRKDGASAELLANQIALRLTWLLANQIALRLTWLLAATSGTFSTYRPPSSREIVSSGRHQVTRAISSAYQIRNNAVLNMDDCAFQEIFARGTDLADKVQFMAKARQASKTGDWESVIKYLVLAYKEKLPTPLDFMRNPSTPHR